MCGCAVSVGSVSPHSRRSGGGGRAGDFDLGKGEISDALRFHWGGDDLAAVRVRGGEVRRCL